MTSPIACKVTSVTCCFSFKRNHFIRNLPTRRMQNIFKICTNKGKFPNELFNVTIFIAVSYQELGSWFHSGFHSLAAKIRIDCSLCLCKCFIEYSLCFYNLTLCRNPVFYLCLYHVYGTKCVVDIKELLRNFSLKILMTGDPKLGTFGTRP